MLNEAKINGDESVVIWGTGKAQREFLHVEDMAAACVHVMQLPFEEYAEHTASMLSHINIGTGEDLTIRELAETVRQVVNFEGSLEFDTSKPDGTPRKLLDVSRLNKLGWRAKIGLEKGLTETYNWFQTHQNDYRA